MSEEGKKTHDELFEEETWIIIEYNWGSNNISLCFFLCLDVGKDS